MNQPEHHDYARRLSENLRDFSEGLEDDEQRDLLRGILSVAHGLKNGKEGSATNGNGAGLVSGFRDAFDPLPSDKVQMIMDYKNNSSSPSTMIVYGEPVATTDTTTEPNTENPQP